MFVGESSLNLGSGEIFMSVQGRPWCHLCRVALRGFDQARLVHCFGSDVVPPTGQVRRWWWNGWTPHVGRRGYEIYEIWCPIFWVTCFFVLEIALLIIWMSALSLSLSHSVDKSGACDMEKSWAWVKFSGPAFRKPRPSFFFCKYKTIPFLVVSQWFATSWRSLISFFSNRCPKWLYTLPNELVYNLR